MDSEVNSLFLWLDNAVYRSIHSKDTTKFLFYKEKA